MRTHARASACAREGSYFQSRIRVFWRGGGPRKRQSAEFERGLVERGGREIKEGLGKGEQLVHGAAVRFIIGKALFQIDADTVFLD